MAFLIVQKSYFQQMFCEHLISQIWGPFAKFVMISGCKDFLHLVGWLVGHFYLFFKKCLYISILNSYLCKLFICVSHEWKIPLLSLFFFTSLNCHLVIRSSLVFSLADLSWAFLYSQNLYFVTKWLTACKFLRWERD